MSDTKTNSSDSNITKITQSEFNAPDDSHKAGRLLRDFLSPAVGKLNSALEAAVKAKGGEFLLDDYTRVVNPLMNDFPELKGHDPDDEHAVNAVEGRKRARAAREAAELAEGAKGAPPIAEFFKKAKKE